ncbi:MAG: mannose-1-phosphate guanylyltransferase/mannose-6-phosphate isomerase [Alphaproteobacteria bacterium]
MAPIIPVILSGGSGSRLWPLSRAHYPKQLLPLVSDRSLLQDTGLRVSDARLFSRPLVICNDEHRFIVAEQLRQVDITPEAIILEPVGRNTAPAIAVAALFARETADDAMLLVLPSDHIIRQEEAFLGAIETAARAAETGALVTFGIAPDRAETGYGYIRAGEELAAAPGCRRVAVFREKPDQATAESYLAEGDWSWNSGMFLFDAGRYLEELERFEPAILAGAQDAFAARRQDLDFLRLDEDAFSRIPGLAIDHAVMERTDRAAVLPVELGWSDVGSWTALAEIAETDSAGNTVLGDVQLRDVHDSYVRSDKRLVAALGVRDLVIVSTDDVTLVAHKDHAQDVKQLVEDLRRSGRPEASFHTRVYRPWGYYQGIDDGPRFQVKQIMVKPGAKLSLQRHMHRAEHWVVVAGTAYVTNGEKEFEVFENQSTFIPIGTVHRLENRGKVPLKLIEVQSGGYLGEDDIERLDDTYGRD